MWNLHILPDHGKVVPPCFRQSYVTKSCLDVILWLDSYPYLYLNSASPPQKKKHHHLKNDAWKTKPFSFKNGSPFQDDIRSIFFGEFHPKKVELKPSFLGGGNGLKSQVSCQGWSHHHLRGVGVQGVLGTKVRTPKPSYRWSDMEPQSR